MIQVKGAKRRLICQITNKHSEFLTDFFLAGGLMLHELHAICRGWSNVTRAVGVSRSVSEQVQAFPLVFSFWTNLPRLFHLLNKLEPSLKLAALCPTGTPPGSAARRCTLRNGRSL